MILFCLVFIELLINIHFFNKGKLREAATNDGVRVEYLEDEKTPTGTCAVLISGKNRSLVPFHFSFIFFFFSSYLLPINFFFFFHFFHFFHFFLLTRLLILLQQIVTRLNISNKNKSGTLLKKLTIITLEDFS